MKSPEIRQSGRTAVGTVAVAAMLSPLNTSMFPVALPDLQREFSTSARASTWLLTVFALASAVGHPLAGYLADRLGPRRVLLAGLVVTGLSGLIAACAATFSLLLVLRTAQALGTATAFPAGIALLRILGSRDRSDRQLPPAWLGAVAMVSNLGAALGPMLGATLLVTVGWRALFLANLPIVIAATLLLLRHFPADRAGIRRDAGGAERSRIVLQRQLFSVSARFAVACTVFFAAFFALPLWLLQSARLGAVGTGAAMAPMVIVSALTTPMAARTVSRSGAAATSLVGTSGLCLGTGLLVTMHTQTSVVVPLAAMVALGASHAFNNLGLQAQLTDGASPARLGTAAGLFQAARFVGAALATVLLGITAASDAITDDFRRLWVACELLSIALLGWAAVSLKRGRGDRVDVAHPTDRTLSSHRGRRNR
jgi:predicted MFS family arabinose efflux permease